ncbi:MAG: hypothetical protein K6B41_00370 [Butyrivibrio sp.]|nr:hypothetical protein [Butyrivibrio sp.]
MADLVINNTANVVTQNNSAPITPPPKVDSSVPKAPSIPKPDTESTKVREELADVVSVSEDGDTVQVSDESETALEDGLNVTVKSTNSKNESEDSYIKSLESNDTSEEIELFGKRTQKVAVEDAIEHKEEASKQQKENIQNDKQDFEIENRKAAMEAKERREEIRELQNESQDSKESVQGSKSFTGVSDDQLQQMYIDGKISQYSYDHEIDSRKAERKEQAEEAIEESEKITDANSKAQDAQRLSEAVEEAYSEDSNDNIESEERAEIINNLENFELPKEITPHQEGLDENLNTKIVFS